MAKVFMDRVRKSTDSIIVVAHTVDLVDQLRKRLEWDEVYTIQSIYSKGLNGYKVMILDECHHYVAEEWRAAETISKLTLGMTATPERADGKPLGNLFDEMVVATEPSELTGMGFLVPCRVIRPPKCVAPDLGNDPVESWILNVSPEQKGLIFARDIAQAEEIAAGIPTALAYHSQLSRDERDLRLQLFREGKVMVLVNVYTLTEGMDFPEAEVVMLARGVGHHSTYLQMVGRVLRPSNGKEQALLIDLPGVSYLYGKPNDKRTYSLEEGIALDKGTQVFQCQRCGWAQEKPMPKCPRCGFEPVGDPRTPPRIYDFELAENYMGAATEDKYQRKELERLVRKADERGWGYYWAAKEFKKLFGVMPSFEGILTPRQKQEEYGRLLGLAAQRGFKSGWAYYRYKATFGGEEP